MPHRYFANRIRYLLERMVLRGAHYRLLVIAMLIGLLSVVAGAVVHVAGGNVDGGLDSAIWWAFLRLSDPGYLGDDEGILTRFVSTILTVLGYVVFLGALVAIMTQWLDERMRQLEAGTSPIVQHGHILIIGWTDRTPTIVQELVLSGSRVRRFLELRGARILRIAILADEVTTRLGLELRDRLGADWDPRQVVLRTGSPLRLEHLQRVDFLHAAAVIMPAADFGRGGPDQADARTIKTLLSMASHPQLSGTDALPPVVAEVFDMRRVDSALRAYSGPVEVLASDAIIGRLLAQTIRHPGLSRVFSELLTHDRGNEIYVRECADLTDMTFAEAGAWFEEAILIGVARRDGASFMPVLNPPPTARLQRDDRLVFVARNYAGTEPVRPGAPPPVAPAVAGPGPAPTSPPLRLLVLGWSHKAAALLRVLDGFADEKFLVDIVSTTAASTRRSALMRTGVRLDRVTVNHIEEDFAVPDMLDRVDVAGYDRIVIVGSDRLGSGEESDARTIMGYLLLRDILPDSDGPAVTVELLDPGNVSLIRRRSTEVIVSPIVLSHMLAQVALRRELRAVFEELFGPGGAEIVFRTAADYGIVGDAVSFADVAGAVRTRGDTALGVRVRTPAGEHQLLLNPPRQQEWTLQPDDEIVTLTRSGAS
ncbi:MAG TPA: hypothetical protein VK929_13485 [Longimicrobiales bacterium]|nr:hypothetical protein [Longimicrobiales bacterium]